jgi:predicted nucleic acid-binding protein
VSVVVDACVVAALIVPDGRQHAVIAQLDEWVQQGQTLRAPTVFPYEIANVLARRVFDGDLAVDEVADIWTDVDELDIRLHALDLVSDGPAIAAMTSRLRRRHATDSAYVCLAQNLSTEVWTLDGPFARNAASMGLPVRLIE